jgi:hypothetical protein
MRQVVGSNGVLMKLKRGNTSAGTSLSDLSLKKGRGSEGTKGGPEMVRRKGESENN